VIDPGKNYIIISLFGKRMEAIVINIAIGKGVALRITILIYQS
jgi:hypothetical protein